jgi:NAD+ synthase (glutamine-hydrolysing)
MGGANPIGGIPKDDITRSLAYFEKEGLAGLSPIHSLYLVNNEKPSAELRKKDASAVQQTDESDLGFSYAQSRIMEKILIEERGTPASVFKALAAHPEFPESAVSRRDMLLGFSKRWEAAQFKRVMGTLAPHVGGNVDPHQAVRTTVR